MGDVRGFLKFDRELPTRRPVSLRVRDYSEVYEEFGEETLKQQAARCMDCGIPFCNQGCPLGNIIPDWNDLVYRNQWRDAFHRLHATNNFPEFTGRLCPAPCESSCVLAIGADPVTIKNIEVTIVDRAWDDGWITPIMPQLLTGKRVGIVGSGPAGLAAAQQLTRAGHAVTVFERDDKPGGLLRYGIPEFKMEKRHLDRRLDQMRAEGTQFHCNVHVGTDLTAEDLQGRFDAVVMAGGATVRRDLGIPGRDLSGIYQAMDYLPYGNRVASGDLAESPISAEGKNVVIIGGGDTGADCLGTALRQRPASVQQFEIMPHPPSERAENNPWPEWAFVYRVSPAHEEGGERVYAVNTEQFLADAEGAVRALKAHEVKQIFADGRMSFEKIEGTDFELPCELVLLAMGFTGAETDGLVAQLGTGMDERGNVARDANYMTVVEGVFVAGDMGRGQSLIVWAIAEGRSCANAVDTYLMGDSELPRPVSPIDQPL
ncbi:MAG: glutamate synthase subunit beta [Acidimicrobiales bacterium]